MFDFDFSQPIINFSDFDISQLGDAFLVGGSILLIGMGAVFGVLCLLWLFLTVFKLIFHDLPKKRSSKKKVAPIVHIPEKTDEAKTEDYGEILAVIAAAVAMAESDDSGTKFRVVSFRRV